MDLCNVVAIFSNNRDCRGKSRVKKKINKNCSHAWYAFKMCHGAGVLPGLFSALLSLCSWPELAQWIINSTEEETLCLLVPQGWGRVSAGGVKENLCVFLREGREERGWELGYDQTRQGKAWRVHSSPKRWGLLVPRSCSGWERRRTPHPLTHFPKPMTHQATPATIKQTFLCLSVGPVSALRRAYEARGWCQRSLLTGPHPFSPPPRGARITFPKYRIQASTVNVPETHPRYHDILLTGTGGLEKSSVA